ncbi:hypothetical protein COU54_04005 [Candidatus Pacearchaeota archaeon CG10_big_fil_rev_8_21_14_0_10_31_24]|nr:MAG: hypothetical protein COU54_04005 [Candidatus Pacearchaeota archaeon CG10_big_fil_rev_8_21_14_0_10_31_24]
MNRVIENPDVKMDGYKNGNNCELDRLRYSEVELRAENVSGESLVEETCRRYYFLRSEKRVDLEDVERRIESKIFESKRLDDIINNERTRRPSEVILDNFYIEKKVMERIPAKKKRLFHKEDYGVHLLIGGTMRDFDRAEDFFLISGLNIETVKDVTDKELSRFTNLARKEQMRVPVSASYSFTTHYCRTYNVSKSALDNFKRYLSLNYKTGLFFESHLNDDTGVFGLVSGDVDKVKEVMKFIKKGGLILKLCDKSYNERFLD